MAAAIRGGRLGCRSRSARRRRNQQSVGVRIGADRDPGCSRIPPCISIRHARSEEGSALDADRRRAEDVHAGPSRTGLEGLCPANRCRPRCTTDVRSLSERQKVGGAEQFSRRGVGQTSRPPRAVGTAFTRREGRRTRFFPMESRQHSPQAHSRRRQAARPAKRPKAARTVRSDCRRYASSIPAASIVCPASSLRRIEAFRSI